MSQISVEQIGKSYRLDHLAGAGRATSLREAAAQGLRRAWGFLGARLGANGSPRRTAEVFWALRDVSFEVAQGEVLGVIGRNGAGKSTLLKILSRITEPTRGRVRIRGRVSSLLEVGTGFHPELTGRENIYLNGAILGMTRREVQARFDQIVAFAEVEKFLDTPVKRYSSGMYVRLAFAVAAHLEPEILIVDEVLAVGDAEFQRKCLGRMQDVASEQGRTVLFVSHNLAAVAGLCSKALYLETGRVQQIGRVDDVLGAYLASARRHRDALGERLDRTGSGAGRIRAIQLLARDGTPLAHGVSGIACALAFELESVRPLRAPRLKFTVYGRHGQALIHCDSLLKEANLSWAGKIGTVLCHFERWPLSAGSYTLNAALMERGETLDYVKDAWAFTVESGAYYAGGRTVEGLNDVCLVEHAWSSHSAGADRPAARLSGMSSG